MKYTIVNKTKLESYQSQLPLLKKEIQEATSFIKDIENGKLNTDLVTSAGQNQDDLASALVSMRNKMISLAEEERQRNWATEGLASFVDILRANNTDIKCLSESILSNLVKYMKANQGWLFVLNDNDPENHFLELTACYAYERKKFLEKRIAPGEGMAGQAYLEKEKIYITEIPKSYPEITSGLGDSVPAAILIMPLKVNDKVFGVMEIGSFHDIPKYQLDFVEKLAESIASTISNVKVNERTKILLSQTQEQTEQLRSQEEEMRQNLEELHATQEEMERKSLEVDKRIDDLNNIGIVSIDFDLNGNILNANRAFMELMGYPLDEIKNQHHRILVEPEEALSQEYSDFWAELKKGVSKQGEYKRIGKNGKVLYLKSCYSIIKDSYGTPQKVVKLAYDITEKVELKMRMQLSRQN